jgi:hypothetical protein
MLPKAYCCERNAQLLIGRESGIEPQIVRQIEPSAKNPAEASLSSSSTLIVVLLSPQTSEHVRYYRAAEKGEIRS